MLGSTQLLGLMNVRSCHKSASSVPRPWHGRRYALLSMAACEAALQLQLPQYASVHEHWKILQNRSEKVVAPAPYPDVLGEHKCSTFGQEVTFVANDWHAGSCIWLPVPAPESRCNDQDCRSDSSALFAIHLMPCAVECMLSCASLAYRCCEL